MQKMSETLPDIGDPCPCSGCEGFMTSSKRKGHKIVSCTECDTWFAVNACAHEVWAKGARYANKLDEACQLMSEDDANELRRLSNDFMSVCLDDSAERISEMNRVVREGRSLLKLLTATGVIYLILVTVYSYLLTRINEVF